MSKGMYGGMGDEPEQILEDEDMDDTVRRKRDEVENPNVALPRLSSREFFAPCFSGVFAFKLPK